jgi:hypothetical protein
LVCDIATPDTPHTAIGKFNFDVLENNYRLGVSELAITCREKPGYIVEYILKAKGVLPTKSLPLPFLCGVLKIYTLYN